MSTYTKQTKAFNSGYDYALSGGGDKSENPYPESDSRHGEWNSGFDSYLQDSANEATEDEYFSDYIEH